jgi:hypothetical protein
MPWHVACSVELAGGEAMTAMPIPPLTFSVGNLMALVVVVTIVSLAALFALALWEIGRSGRRTVRLRCPVRLRRVRVVFGTGPHGEPVDVVRCSVFGRRPITCGKACLHA